MLQSEQQLLSPNRKSCWITNRFFFSGSFWSYIPINNNIVFRRFQVISWFKGLPLRHDVIIPEKLRNNRAWRGASCVSYALTSVGGGAIKACFSLFPSVTNSILKEPRSQSDVRLHTSYLHQRFKLADEAFANQVITREESKSYRMSRFSGIQNLCPFGKCVQPGGWGKGEFRLSYRGAAASFRRFSRSGVAFSHVTWRVSRSTRFLVGTEVVTVFVVVKFDVRWVF